MTEQMETAVDTTIEATETETTPEGVENVPEVTEEPAQTSEGTEVADGAEVATEDTVSGDDADDGLVFTPVYNGAVTPIKASDTERVTSLLQKGMKFENMADDLEKLHQLASAYGAKTTTEMLDRMLEVRENEKTQRVAKHGTFKEADEAADKASRMAINERLATELVELQGDHPDVASIKDLPKSVVDTALQKGIPLLDAYNRHILKEQKRTASAVQKQTSNQKASVGSLSDSGGETSDPVWEAFLRGAKH